MFKVNELVVYPSQGVGRVERIESQEIGGVKADFYIVRILSNNVTLMVPVANATNVGLRSVCSKRIGQKIFESLKDRSEFTGYTGQNWNRRYREYSEKLKSGDLSDVAYVLKELFLIGKDKELSFGERRLLEQAMGSSPWNWPTPSAGNRKSSRKRSTPCSPTSWPCRKKKNSRTCQGPPFTITP